MKILLPLGAFALISAAQATTINVGSVGFGPNQWPGGEPPEKAIDGLGAKYLNFGKQNTGVVVTPSAAAAATSITLWAANDSPERDPGMFTLFGTNDDVSGDLDSSIFTFVAGGLLSLPDSRNNGGINELLESNSTSVSFSNTDPFTSYMVLFPNLKNGGGANSMQVAEIQIFDAAKEGIFAPGDTILGVQAVASLVPEPSTGLLALVGLAGLLRRRRC